MCSVSTFICILKVLGVSMCALAAPESDDLTYRTANDETNEATKLGQPFEVQTQPLEPVLSFVPTLRRRKRDALNMTAAQLKAEIKMKPRAKKKENPSQELDLTNNADRRTEKIFAYLVDIVGSFKKALKDACEIMSYQKTEIKQLRKLIQKKDDENKAIKVKVVKFDNEVNDLQQRARLINVLVNGIPEKGRREDIMKIVENIGHKLGIADPLNQVQRAHRVNSTSKNQPHKPIVIRLLNTRTRDNWTAAYRRKKLWKEQWYMSEHLTRTNQDLLYKTKLWAKENNFKFVWTRGCKTRLRKDEHSRIYTINNLEQLQDILSQSNKTQDRLTDRQGGANASRFSDTLSKNNTNISSSVTD